MLNESRALKNSAQKAFQNIAESLQKLPQTIARNKELLAQKKNALIETEKRKVLVLQVRADKNLFIQDVNRLATLAKNKSQAQEPDSTFGQASDKFQETISLLKKDLAETENLLAEKEQEIIQARDAVTQAANNLNSSVKLLETTPEQLKEQRANPYKRLNRRRHFGKKNLIWLKVKLINNLPSQMPFSNNTLVYYLKN